MSHLNSAYSEYKNKYLQYLLPIALAGILYIFTVPLGFIYLIVGTSYVAIFLPNIIKKFTVKDDEDLAWEYLQQKWKAKTGETLSIRDGWSTSTYFGDKGRSSLFYAFSVHRGEIGEKKHQPFVGIIQVEPLRKAGWTDEPSLELQKDPFKLLSSSFRGAPSPDMKPEFETSLRNTQNDKKIKEKKQTEENNISPNMVVEND